MKIPTLRELKLRFERQGFRLTLSAKTALLRAHILPTNGGRPKLMTSFDGRIEAAAWIDGFEFAREIYDDTEEAT